MGLFVCNGASLTCSFGAAPGTLITQPSENVMTGTPVATIMDNVPMTNIMPFGVCSSLANPTVASATSAALGVLTPQPCVPVIPAPWAPGVPTTLVSGKPAVNSDCMLTCAYGGVIKVANPGQTKTIV